MTVDLAIIGVNGMTPTHGLTTTNPEEAATKRAMLLSARRRIVPVISGRIGRNSFCSFAAINEVDLVITDAAANPEIVAELAAAGPEVVIAHMSSRGSAPGRRPSHDVAPRHCVGRNTDWRASGGERRSLSGDCVSTTRGRTDRDPHLSSMRAREEDRNCEPDRAREPAGNN